MTIATPSFQEVVATKYEKMCSDWSTGSVVEYNPPPWSRWLPALVTATTPDNEMLTVEFVMMGVPHEHSVHRTSQLLSPLGNHESALPPGFWGRPSKSRPGQLAFYDKVTGARYGSEQLAWKVHLERVLRMEALPTVCDERPIGNRRFTWPSPPTEAPVSGPVLAAVPAAELVEEVSTSEIVVVESFDVGAIEVQEKPLEDNPDVCFSANVFAELMAAPSPANLPTGVFGSFDQDVENAGSLNKEQEQDKMGNDVKLDGEHLCREVTACKVESLLYNACKVISAASPMEFTQWRPCPSPTSVPVTVEVIALKTPTKVQPMLVEVFPVTMDVLPIPADVTSFPTMDVLPAEPTKKSSPRERVANLEGALEASRDRVKELETMHLNAAGKSECVEPAESEVYQDQASQVGEHFLVPNIPHPSPHQSVELESVQSETVSAIEGFNRVEELLTRINTEENLLKKAIAIVELRRTTHEVSGSCDAWDDYEPHFAELQHDIRERHAQLAKVVGEVVTGEKKEHELERLRLSLQAREHVNIKFEENLLEWERHLVASKSRATHPVRQSFQLVAPPQPRAQTRTVLQDAPLIPAWCSMTPPRPPRSDSPSTSIGGASSHATTLPPPMALGSARLSPPAGPAMALGSARLTPPAGPAGGAAGRAAAAAAATLVSKMARSGPARCGSCSVGVSGISVASHVSSFSTVGTLTPCGSPQGSRVFRTPIQTSRRSLSPGLQTSRGRGSQCSSAVGSSIRSGSSTTAPSDSSPANTGSDGLQVRHYTGSFTHPWFGPDDIPIEVTFLSQTDGLWCLMGRSEQISVQREGKIILMTDKAGTTTFDGHEVVGGMLIGTVTQDGEAGGRFRLQPGQKRQARVSLVKRTCTQRSVLVPVSVPLVTRVTHSSGWRSVGVPAKLTVQSGCDNGWKTSYQAAFS